LNQRPSGYEADSRALKNKDLRNIYRNVGRFIWILPSKLGRIVR